MAVLQHTKCCSYFGSKAASNIGFLVPHGQEMARRRTSFHSDEYRRFRQKLKEARAEAGLTQRKAANELGKPASYIAKIEMGERRVDFIELKRIARLYQKPLRYFED